MFGYSFFEGLSFYRRLKIDFGLNFDCLDYKKICFGRLRLIIDLNQNFPILVDLDAGSQACFVAIL
jgi:hypothetical protein